MTITIERRADKERKDGTAQLRLRITHEGRQRYHPLGIYVRSADWDATRARIRGRSQQVADTNARLAHAEQVASDAVAARHRSGEPITAELIRDAVRVQLVPSGERPDGDFVSYARAYNEAYRQRGKYRTWKRVNAILNKLEPFLHQRVGKEVPFEAVNVRLMREWTDHLMASKEDGGHANAENTAATNLNAVRTICRAAIREDVAPPGWRDPTQGIRLRQRPAQKERLTRPEIDALAALGPDDGLGDGTTYYPGQWRSEGTLLALVRDMFLFALYVAGVRFGDAAQLRMADVREQNGVLRVYYRMGKSSDDMGLLLPGPAAAIYQRYAASRADLPSERTGGRLFGLLDGRTVADGSWSSARARSNALGTANTLANKNLKTLARLAKIKRGANYLPLSTHMARHSWADLARQGDWSISDIQQALGHSSPTVTQRYLAGFDQSRLDEKMNTLF